MTEVDIDQIYSNSDLNQWEESPILLNRRSSTRNSTSQEMPFKMVMEKLRYLNSNTVSSSFCESNESVFSNETIRLLTTNLKGLIMCR